MERNAVSYIEFPLTRTMRNPQLIASGERDSGWYSHIVYCEFNLILLNNISSDRADMGGIGTFSRENSTLYIGGVVGEGVEVKFSNKERKEKRKPSKQSQQYL